MTTLILLLSAAVAQGSDSKFEDTAPVIIRGRANRPPNQLRPAPPPADSPFRREAPEDAAFHEYHAQISQLFKEETAAQTPSAQAAAIRKAGKLLGHFHACGSDRGTPGNDHIDWKPIAKALKDVKYHGDVVIESFTTDVKVIARAAAIWRKMEPTRDEIATKGIKFLKKALA